MKLRDILRETAAEIREIEAIARLVAAHLAKLQQSDQPNRIYDAFALKQVVQPRFQNAAVNNLVNGVTVQVSGHMRPTSLGSWKRLDNKIEINASLIRPQLDEPELIKTLAHEFTHAMDSFKGIQFKRQADAKTVATDQKAYQHYLQLQHEIDARLTEALISLAQEIQQQKNLDDLFSEPGTESQAQQILWRAIQQVFARSQLTQLYPEGTRDPRYRRLLTRAYKFYATPQAVAQAARPTLIQRALSWIKAR